MSLELAGLTLDMDYTPLPELPNHMAKRTQRSKEGAPLTVEGAFHKLNRRQAMAGVVPDSVEQKNLAMMMKTRVPPTR